MRIQRQIGLGFLGVVAVAGLATMTALASQAYVRRASESVREFSKLHADAALLERAVAKLVEGAAMAHRTDNPIGRQLINEGSAELAASLASLEQLRLDPSMATELDELKVLAGSATAAHFAVVSIAKDPGPKDDIARTARDRDRALSALETRRWALVLKVELFTDHARARAHDAELAADRLWRRATLGTVTLLAAALALATALSLGLARRIATPIELLASVARRVGAGELSARSSVARRDEIGELATVLDQMLDELQAAQARLVRAERLAAIGEVTVTMKHELNNPLHGISAAVSLLLDRREGMSASTCDVLEMIREAAARMTAVTTKLDGISEPVSKEYLGDVRMLDLERSAK